LFNRSRLTVSVRIDRMNVVFPISPVDADESRGFTLLNGELVFHKLIRETGTKNEVVSLLRSCGMLIESRAGNI